jgi:hypothetical protein
MQRAAVFIVSEGLPMLCELAIRESTTAPGRIKVGFVADIPEEGEVLATGAAAEQLGEVSTLPEGAGGKSLMGPEFRLEMN